MASLQARITEALARRAALQAAIDSTSHADAAGLATSEEYIQDLEKQINHHNDHFNDYAHIKRRQQMGWRPHDAPENTVRRLAATLRGKKAEFDEKGKEHDAMWNKALEDERKEKQFKMELAETLENAKRAHEELETVNRKRQHHQRQLDLLYEAVFRGPLPPDCAAVDLAECYVAPATKAMEEARRLAENEAQAARILTNAEDTISSALGSISDALGASKGDMIPLSSDAAAHHKRRSMMQAETRIAEARQQVIQAQSLIPEVQGLPRVREAHGNVAGDISFDNFFSDLAYHDKIKAMQQDTKKLQTVLDKEVVAANRRVKSAQEAFEDAKLEMESAKESLRKARVEAFERLLAAAGGDATSAVAPTVTVTETSPHEPPPYRP